MYVHTCGGAKENLGLWLALSTVTSKAHMMTIYSLLKSAICKIEVIYICVALDQKYSYEHTNIRRNEHFYTFLCNVTNHTQEEIHMYICHPFEWDVEEKRVACVCVIE